MRQMLCFAAFALVALGSVGTAEAGLLGGRGCGGGGGCGGGHRSHGGGCGGGGCASGYATGGCATGHCGAPVAGHTGGYCIGGSCPVGVGVAAVDGPRAATVVNLPADARLLVDGQATRSESARRVFETPALETGKEFYYNLQAELVRDGKTEVITQRVLVRAGESTEVRLDLPTTSVAAR
jgi:uncharacterized protein (TIGR03000 family)